MSHQDRCHLDYFKTAQGRRTVIFSDHASLSITMLVDSIKPEVVFSVMYGLTHPMDIKTETVRIQYHVFSTFIDYSVIRGHGHVSNMSNV